ncbi:copper homeostasis protein cutC homolog [Marmota marmota marmota]|uniref:copper homeostasis protein cutC homolog n=1 Tax=Marmota marmota marmota TaxID=9994 RepID=UPI0020931A15|nr:copper homeostasis protein cutC homolog [Marmota marmota marmota]
MRPHIRCAALGTKSRTLWLPSKVFKGGKSNRCIVTPAHNSQQHKPALHGLLSPPQKAETLPGQATRAPHSRETGTCAGDSASRRGCWGSGLGDAHGARRRGGRAYPVARAATPARSGNRRHPGEKRVEHEEAGGVLRAETSVDSVGEGATNGFLMEVCVDSVESAVNAERGGAGRIELCSGLLEGGTTPSMGVLQVVKQSVQIPVFVMIRPRGGDFLYSDREIEVMKADIRLAKLYGADGLVFGALTEDGHVDKELCMSLVAICRPLPVTFHRAFDMVHNPMAALETLLSLGFERVLTSGCDSSALEGLPLIKRLIDQAKGRIVVMPGIYLSLCLLA